MGNTLGSLNDSDIRQLTLLIESLEHSTFDFLQIEIGDLKVTIGKGDVPLPADWPVGGAKIAAPIMTPPSVPAPVSNQPARATHVAPPAPKISPPSDGMVEIAAPLLGVFYAQSEPGAPPFVTVGSEVREDTTVALIEVMKTFNAVPAGRCGTITEICVENAQLVEFAQVLFRVRPA